jgi:hypothetical protein
LSAGASTLTDALALAFAHGPLAGIAPALAAERQGSIYRVRACWSLLDGSVALEARGTSLDACHERVASLVLKLWPELQEAAAWL